MFIGLERALADLKSGQQVCPYKCNMRVQAMYNWLNVTTRTEKVYNLISAEPRKELGDQLNRLESILNCHLLWM